ncbi:MAG: hypothetical protein AUK47_29180 [Deltaproteobacteria bacterium CG2_30_63_29]|nr:MAG: hypothetical protein AUK47_29180 [Deltaproteobacteria bacterium CG2_30_63_29]
MGLDLTSYRRPKVRQIPLQFRLCVLLAGLLSASCHAGHAEETHTSAPAEPAAAELAQPLSAPSPLVLVRPLGRPPLCEPSALARAPWDPALALVGDNELDDTLFAFSLEDGSLQGQHDLELPKGVRPHDLEAMVALGPDELVFVGSHSRNKHCERRPKRHRLQSITLADDGSWLPGHSIDTDADELFASLESCAAAFPAGALAQTTCTALVDARERADQGEKPCEALNIEGAAQVADRIWLGLRGPQLDGKALLLRLVWPTDTLRFDGVATVDLAGAGVRELAATAEQLYVISGPQQDGGEFALWSLPLTALEADTALVPTKLRALPPSSEGLLLTDTDALVVIDGRKGDDAQSCAVDGQQALLPLHPDSAKTTSPKVSP